MNKNKSWREMKRLNEKVEPSNALSLLEDMIKAYGSDIILRELSKSMGNVELADNLSYIAENLRFRHPLIWGAWYDEDEDEDDE